MQAESIQTSETKTYHGLLKEKMDIYAHGVYAATRRFPREELFGITSQFRRSGLSVVLNYIEGYARMGGKVYAPFLRQSYGSLKESKYLVEFAYQEQYLEKSELEHLFSLADEIGKML